MTENMEVAVGEKTVPLFVKVWGVYPFLSNVLFLLYECPFRFAAGHYFPPATAAPADDCFEEMAHPVAFRCGNVSASFPEMPVATLYP